MKYIDHKRALKDVIGEAGQNASPYSPEQSHGVVSLADTVLLARGRVHEVTGNSADMFAVLVASKLDGPVIWIGLESDVGSLAPTALQHYLDPARIILTEGITRLEILWAMEQVLRTSSVACVVAELSSGPNLRESRRLQVAAEEGGCLGLVLIDGRVNTSAAETRWQCLACRHRDNTWFWKLIKNRQGQLGSWRASWTGGDNAPGVIHLVSTATT